MPLTVPSVFSRAFESAQQTITAAGALTLAHGLGVKPQLVQAFAVCTDAAGEQGYAQNDEVCCPIGLTYNAGNLGVTCVPDATNLNIRFGSQATTTLTAQNKTTGSSAILTNTKWKILFRAWA